MADFHDPIIGNAGEFERGSKEILARAEAALRASVQVLGEMRGVATQIEAAGTASAGEERAADAINRKADAANRAANAIARQNTELRAAGNEVTTQDRAATAMERKAVAAERVAASTRAIHEANLRGQGALFDEAASGHPRVAGSLAPGNEVAPSLGFAMPPAQRPLAEVYEEEAVASRAAAEAMRGHVAALENEAAELRLAASQAPRAGVGQRPLIDERDPALTLFGGTGGRPLADIYEEEAVAHRAAAEATRAHVAALEEEAAQLRLAASRPPGAAPGQPALLDERGAQPALFGAVGGRPRAEGFEAQAQALERTNTAAREAAAAEERLGVMGREAALSQVQLAAAQREAAQSGGVLSRGVGGMARGYAEFLGVATGVGIGISAFHNIVQGAQQAQEGVQDLKRVLRSVNEEQATQGFRDLSQQFNVPISDVAQAQFGFSRVFSQQPDAQNQALEATRAALAATKLDAIGAGDSVKYLTVAVQAFHLTGQQLSASGGVFDQLENVSRRMGVPVGQLMQSFRALPAVANTGGNITDFIALTATMARASGRSGTEINTAIARAATNFVPRNADKIRSEFDLNPNESITQLLMDAAEKSRNLSPSRRRDLANLIGGPLRGGSTILGLLNRPDTLQEALKEADPRVAAGATAEEMRQVMGRVDTQVQEVGRHLAVLGVALSQSGVLDGLGLVTKALDSLITKGTTLADIFRAVSGGVGRGLDAIIPGHETFLRHALPVGLEVGGALALARRTSIGERLGGPLAFLKEPLTSPLAEGRRSLSAERSAIKDALASTRSQAAGAASDLRVAARAGDEEAAVAAQGRLNALRAREGVLIEESTALANRNARQQMALNAARERELGLLAAEGGIAEGETVAGMRMGGPKGRLAAAGAGFSGAGALNFLKGAGTLALYAGAFEMLQGFTETQGNLPQRLAGGGQSILGLVGIHTGPVTNVQQRAEGLKAANRYIGSLAGGADYNAADERVMNARRMALTRQLGRIDEATNISERQANVERRVIQAELSRETAIERSAVELRRQREGGKANPHAFAALSSADLAELQTQALRPMADVGDARGYGVAVQVADQLVADAHRQAAAGNRKHAEDLYKKAEDAIKSNVSAISAELQDNLALANDQGGRDQAYQQAIDQANKLLSSHSPAQRHAGELLKRQTAIQRAQEDAQADATNTAIANARRPGATITGAERAARDARTSYLRYADQGLAHTQEGRAAYQKYVESQNAVTDARLQRVQLETATAQAGQATQAGKDRALVQGLQRQITAEKAAPHPDANKLADLYNQLSDARTQLGQQDAQDANAALDARYQYLEAQTDDPLTQALLAYQDAVGQQLDKSDPHAAAKKRALVAQRAQAIRQQRQQQAEDLIQGNQAMRDAAIDPFDQVALDRSAERAAREHLANLSPGADPGQRKQAQAAVIAAQHKTVRDRQQMSYDDIEFNAQIGKYTTDMEVSALRRLEGTVKNNKALKRQIAGQIYQLTHETGGDLQLNLGALKLPTPYEVDRAIREGGNARGATGRQVAVHNHNQVNVTVSKAEHAGTVAHHIDRLLKTSTRSAMRAAGAI